MALSVQTRPEPMNSSPHHSKVKVSLTLPHSIYVAGRDIAGKMEVECRADKGLGIGIMMVELFASQELTSRDHSATSTFLHSRRLFQGPGLPPSNAVQPHPQPGDAPLPQGYHQARRGISTFLFRIPLPSSSPPSINFGSDLARVRYEVRATVGVIWKGEKRLVICKKEVDVVESYELDYARIEPEGIVVGEFGKIWVQGKVVGGIIVAGESACVELQVKNHSSKKNHSLTLTLSRSLVLPGLKPGESSPLQISDVLTTVPFRGPEYIIPPGVEGIASLVFDVPLQARGVRGGTLQGDESEARTSESLFEIRCILGITLNMGMGTKDIQLSIPVPTVHPAALPEEPLAEYSNSQRLPYPASTPYPYAMSPPPPTTTTYIDPIHKQVWLPPPQTHSYTPQPNYTSPPIVNGDHYYFPPPPQVPVVTYLPPPRPLSAGMSTNNDAAIPRSALPPTSSSPSQQQQQQLVVVPISALNVEPIEGKGERAARVTQHLRLSSRHRSVSPQSHRFPFPAPSTGGGGGGDALYPFPGGSVPESQPDHDHPVSMRNLPPPPLLPHASSRGSLPTHPKNVVGAGTGTGTMVHSPRPVLSPRHSFSHSLPKSDRVEQLERMADEVIKTTTDLSADLPKPLEQERSPHVEELLGLSPQRPNPVPESNINKTLPVPPPHPQPTTRKAKDKTSAAEFKTGKIRINEFFTDIPNPSSDGGSPNTLAAAAAADNSQAPPTPLAAVTPIRLPFKPKPHESHAQLHPSGRSESGLDALERRLLAEVGTRKVDSGKERPPVWDVVGGAPNAGVAHPIDIPSKTVLLDPLNDSAISSLTLAGEHESAGGAGVGAGVGVGVSGGEGSAEADDVGLLLEVEVEHDSDEKTHRPGKSSVSGDSRGDRSGERGRKKTNKKERKDKTGSSGTSRAAKKSAAAKGRVAAWLGGIDPEVPPAEEVLPSSVVLKKMPSFSGRVDGPSRASRDDKEEVKDGTSGALVALLGDDTIKAAVKEEHATPNPRSSGFVPIDTFKHGTPSRHLRPFDGKATVVKEARHVEEIWSSAPTAKDIFSSPKDVSSLRPLISARPMQSIRPDRNVSPPSMAGAVDLLGAKYHNVNMLKVPLPANSTHPKPVSKKATNDQSPRVPALPPHMDPEVKYDVRSARGGRGGRVTAITAIWAAGGTEGNVVAATKNNIKSAPKTTTQLLNAGPKASTVDPVSLDTEGNSRTPVKSSSVASSPSIPPSRPVERSSAARRAPLIKSPSVPAILSSSHATPTLSSTASLARPPTNQTRFALTKIPPAIPEVSSEIKPYDVKLTTDSTKPVSTNQGGQMAFGQARLRDLIKKYQGQAS